MRLSRSSLLCCLGLLSLAATASASIHPCVLTATTYHPSALELSWTANVAKWTAPAVLARAPSTSKSAEYCKHVTPHVPAIRAWLAGVQSLMRNPFSHHAPQTNATDLLSHFTYHYECGKGLIHTQRSVIEPLFGALRHPLFACAPGAEEESQGDNGWLLSKDYLLLQTAFAAPVAMERTAPKFFIFDLGASTYTEGGGGASQQWFVERYEERGFTLDGYYGWEVTPHPAEEVLEKVPKTLLPHYIYFNVPAVTGVDDLANPLNIMKAVAQAGDYVVLKLDIDNSPVELQFIKQILADPSIAELIDELFFEHHVNFRPLHGAWKTQQEAQTLADSYAIFTQLRGIGIRAHGWV